MTRGGGSESPGLATGGIAVITGDDFDQLATGGGRGGGGRGAGGGEKSLHIKYPACGRYGVAQARGNTICEATVVLNEVLQ